MKRANRVVGCASYLPLRNELCVTNFDTCLGSIYLIENNRNDKKYVGLTTDLPEKRFRRHLYESAGKKTKLAVAIRRFGQAAFSFRVLARSRCRKRLVELERKFIKQFDSIACGYNTLPGGSCGYSQGISVAFKGKRFRNKKDLATYLGIDRKTLYRREALGVPLDAAISKPSERGLSLTYKGKHYDTIVSLSKKFGLTPQCAAKRLKQGVPLERKTWTKPIIYRARKFESRRTLASYLGISYDSLQWRIRSGIVKVSCAA